MRDYYSSLQPAGIGSAKERLELCENLSQCLGDHYALVEIVSGRTGHIFKLYNTFLDRFEAARMVKVDDHERDDRALVELCKEAQVVSALKSKSPRLSIPTIYNFHQIGNIGCYTMNFIEGERLQDLLEVGCFSLSHVEKIIRKLSRILEVVQAADIAYRRIELDDVLIDHKGRPWLVDFSIFRGVDTDTTKRIQRSLVVSSNYSDSSMEMAIV